MKSPFASHSLASLSSPSAGDKHQELPTDSESADQGRWTAYYIIPQMAACFSRFIRICLYGEVNSASGMTRWAKYLWAFRLFLHPKVKYDKLRVKEHSLKVISSLYLLYADHVNMKRKQLGLNVCSCMCVPGIYLSQRSQMWCVVSFNVSCDEMHTLLPVITEY